MSGRVCVLKTVIFYVSACTSTVYPSERLRRRLAISPSSFPPKNRAHAESEIRADVWLPPPNRPKKRLSLVRPVTCRPFSVAPLRSC